MLDEFFVQQTLNSYSDAASRLDVDQLLSLYLPDAVWEIPFLNLKFEGHDAIRAGVIATTEMMDYVVQLNAPAIINIEGDTATTRSVIHECEKYTGRDEALEVFGIYSDTLVKTPDGWKFARREFEKIGMHKFPLLARKRE